MLSAIRESIAWYIVFLLFNVEECSALCGTEEEALSEVRAAIGLWIETAREHLGGYSCGEGCPPRTDGVITHFER
jgi:hypothetical protein